MNHSPAPFHEYLFSVEKKRLTPTQTNGRVALQRPGVGSDIETWAFQDQQIDITEKRMVTLRILDRLPYAICASSVSVAAACEQ